MSLGISLYLKGPKKRTSFYVPPKVEPLWKQMPIPEPYSKYLLGSPVKEPLLQVPLVESPQRESCPVPRAFLHF